MLVILTGHANVVWEKGMGKITGKDIEAIALEVDMHLNNSRTATVTYDSKNEKLQCGATPGDIFIMEINLDTDEYKKLEYMDFRYIYIEAWIKKYYGRCKT